MPAYRYPWPASAITPEDMAVLYQERELSEPRLPITELIARAVRQTYGLRLPVQVEEERKAA